MDQLDDLATAHAASAKGAHAVFAAPDGLTRPFELPFGEERPCPPGRSPADQLAAFLGRTVD